MLVDTQLPVLPGYFVKGGPQKYSPTQYLAVKKYLLRKESKYRWRIGTPKMSVFLPPHYHSPSFVLSCLAGASYYERSFSMNLCLMVCLDLGLELWPLLGLEKAEQHTVPRAEIT